MNDMHSAKLAEPLVRIDDVCVYFPVSGGIFSRSKQLLRAVNNLSLTLNKGECLSIVGESGCGKSTLALSLVGLQKPTSGQIYFEGRPITGKDEPSRLERAKMAQMVFQDPFASLNPRQTVYTSCRFEARAGKAFSARVFGWATPAHRHSTRAAAQSESYRA